MTYFQPVTCPFCLQHDFDLIGLKAHLQWCVAFNKTLTLEQESAAQLKKIGGNDD